MSTNKDIVGSEIDDSWRPPTHGAGKLLWFMTVEEFDQLRQGELSKNELKQRVAKRDPNQRPLSVFKDGDRNE